MWEFDSLIPNHRSSKVAADFFSGCSAVGSALGSGPRGRGFESRHSDHKKLFHRLVKELFVFHGVTGFEPTASPQRDTSSPVDCLRGCGRIRARLPHKGRVLFHIQYPLFVWFHRPAAAPQKRLDKARAFQPGILSSHCFF